MSTCYQCRTRVRSMAEHLTTERHRAATTSVRSSGPGGSHAYRPPVRIGSQADYWAEREREALEAEALVQPPTVDALPPIEYEDELSRPLPAVRDHRPEDCPRCGKSFRTEAGRAWHEANNPRCDRWMSRKSAA